MEQKQMTALNKTIRSFHEAPLARLIAVLFYNNMVSKIFVEQFVCGGSRKPFTEKMHTISSGRHILTG